MKQVTKLEAYLDVIDRVMGNKPLGYNDQTGVCVYDKAYGGGCAIGKHLPDNELRAYRGGVEALFREYPSYAAHFEDPGSKFWYLLQRLHDTAAMGAWTDKPTEPEASRFSVGHTLIEISRFL